MAAGAARREATFPTGPARELRWHPGYVFEAKVSVMDGARRVQSYRLFFPIDQQDEWVQEPLDKSLCFIKPSSQATGGTRLSAAELATARNAVCEE